jgi:bifunctional DNA-binding transcriptional regulator/antitoxin component of YhaV-PrlF toxin-antitoxin module
MLRTRVDEDFRVTIPESLRPAIQVGDELFVSIDQNGRILLIPEKQVNAILEQTAGMWEDRKDIPRDSIDYVNQLRQGRRLQDFGVIADDRD